MQDFRQFHLPLRALSFDAGLVCFLCAAIGILYMGAAAILVHRFFSREPAPSAAAPHYPPVSLVKPLYGAEHALLAQPAELLRAGLSRAGPVRVRRAGRTRSGARDSRAVARALSAARHHGSWSIRGSTARTAR
ncbi:MAG: hypothetical protein WDN30_03130 [Pararobbsia sp.]